MYSLKDTHAANAKIASARRLHPVESGIPPEKKFTSARDKTKLQP